MKQSLTIDQGNSSAKVSVFEGGAQLRSWRFEKLSAADAVEIAASHSVGSAIYSSVAGTGEAIVGGLRAAGIRVAVLDHTLPTPLTVDYATPATLGHDRIAAAAGATVLLPGRNALVVDAGTAVTLDFVTASRHFAGGNIAPGLSLRLQALESHCAQLPEIGADGDVPLLGYDTATAIRAGVVQGMASEVDNLARLLAGRYGSLSIILTGGDGGVIAPRLSHTEVSVEPDLVAIGLNRILEYNEIQH